MKAIDIKSKSFSVNQFVYSNHCLQNKQCKMILTLIRDFHAKSNSMDFMRHSFIFDGLYQSGKMLMIDSKFF